MVRTQTDAYTDDKDLLDRYEYFVKTIISAAKFSIAIKKISYNCSKPMSLPWWNNRWTKAVRKVWSSSRI